MHQPRKHPDNPVLPLGWGSRAILMSGSSATTEP
jgi:hypothetical protein